jgi:hypothetical protein
MRPVTMPHCDHAAHTAAHTAARHDGAIGEQRDRVVGGIGAAWAATPEAGAWERMGGADRGRGAARAEYHVWAGPDLKCDRDGRGSAGRFNDMARGPVGGLSLPLVAGEVRLRLAAYGNGGAQFTRLSRPAQNGSRSRAFSTLPAPDSGSGSARTSTLRGHL